MRCSCAFTRLTTLALALSLLGAAHGGSETDGCSDREDDGYYSCLSDDEADYWAGLYGISFADLRTNALKLEETLHTAEQDIKNFATNQPRIEVIQNIVERILDILKDHPESQEKTEVEAQFKAILQNTRLALQCPICYEQYSIDRVPHVSRCGHFACGHCSTTPGVLAECPTCRATQPHWDTSAALSFLYALKNNIPLKEATFRTHEAILRDHCEEFATFQIESEGAIRTQLDFERLHTEALQPGLPAHSELQEFIRLFLINQSWSWWFTIRFNELTDTIARLGYRPLQDISRFYRRFFGAH